MRSGDPIADGRRIADAIARAVDGAPAHLVMLSSLGAHHPEGTGLSATLHAAEERLGPGVLPPSPVTFVRAAFFLENWVPVLGAAAAASCRRSSARSW